MLFSTSRLLLLLLLACACSSAPAGRTVTIDERLHRAQAQTVRGLQALMDSGLLETAGAPLGEAERALLQSVFGDSLAVDRIRWIVNSVEPDAPPRTLGNTIVLTPDLDPRKPGMLEDSYFRRTLVHEAAHVWQFQHRGAGYVVDAVSHQASAFARTGDRGSAYAYLLTDETTLDALGSEPQAQLVMEWYALSALDEKPRRCEGYDALGKEEFLKLAAEVLDRDVRSHAPDPEASPPEK